MWIRFEGPGRLQAGRWHMVEGLPGGRVATLCGSYVLIDGVVEERDDGAECATCRVAYRTRSHEVRQPLAV